MSAALFTQLFFLGVAILAVIVILLFDKPDKPDAKPKIKKEASAR